MAMTTPSTPAPSTPGSVALEKVRSREIAEFKKPSLIKKQKQKILTEEKYIEELSKIIQRDFFPDLEKLRAQNGYLDAMERKDYAAMQSIRAKYSGQRPESQKGGTSPATFETPVSAVGGTPRNASDTPKSMISIRTCTTESGSSPKSIADKHSLDSFLAVYTSEDNSSFQEIVDAADEKLRQKFAVFYNEEGISAEKLAKSLILPSIDQQFDQPDPMRKIETWNYTNKNSIMYIPDGVELTEKERIEKAQCKQEIQHRATRLTSNPFDVEQKKQDVSQSTQSQNKVFSEKIGVDGKVIVPTMGAAPQIRGFDLVATPSPRPGEAFSPLMTWGEIEGTPFRLDGSDTPVRSNIGPSFRINENSRRENIGLALAEKVGEKMRAQKQQAKDAARKNISSPFIRSNMERLASMSPAARRLASTKLGLRTPTVTPRRTPLSAKKKSSLGPEKRTPIAIKSHKLDENKSRKATPKSSASQISKSTLTDDLLKIPKKTKRPSAADFF